MYRKGGEMPIKTLKRPIKRKIQLKSDWDRMADIAEKAMELKGFTADDVRLDLIAMRNGN